MSIFEQVALEYGCTEDEIQREISASIDLAGIELDAEDLILVVASSIIANEIRS